MKQRRKFTVLYPSESLAPLILSVVCVALLIFFYIRNLNIDSEAASIGVELLPAFVFAAFAVFVVLYMLMRTITIDEEGLHYKSLNRAVFLSWNDVHYVKITKNSNGKYGRGSYIVVATYPYASEFTDFRACSDGFIVLRKRRRAIELIQKYYKDEIINLKTKHLQESK